MSIQDKTEGSGKCSSQKKSFGLFNTFQVSRHREHKMILSETLLEVAHLMPDGCLVDPKILWENAKQKFN